MKKNIMGLLSLGIVVSAFADAPVVDYSANAASTADTAQTFAMAQPPVSSKLNLSAEQRLNRLEQQVHNINSQNLISKIEELQQNLQKINGKFETQMHQIEQLDKQIKEFYQDLNQRLGGAKNSALTTPASTTTTTASPDEPAVVAATQTTAIPAATTATSANKSAATSAADSALVPATNNNVTGIFDNTSPTPSANVNTDSAFLKEQQMYQTAIDLLPDKKHESENKLRDYLKQYPKGTYVANAHYWLGEINYLQKNFDTAEEEFKIVVEKYAKSKRVADAMLKLALVHQNQGREIEAKKELQKIISRYPKSSAAQLAKQQLKTSK